MMDKICVLLNDKKLNYGNIRVLQNEVRKVGLTLVVATIT